MYIDIIFKETMALKHPKKRWGDFQPTTNNQESASKCRTVGPMGMRLFHDAPVTPWHFLIQRFPGSNILQITSDTSGSTRPYLGSFESGEGDFFDVPFSAVEEEWQQMSK